MFPISDNAPQYRFPFVNYLLIAINLLVFIFEYLSLNPDSVIVHYAFTPAEFSPYSFPFFEHIVYSMFIHAGFFHIFSNMWVLFIFGDNVEGILGHFPYLIFYLFSGLVAALSQYAVAPHSSDPMVGASGAVAGVLGAYLVYFYRATILSLLFITIARIPAWLFIGYWFVLQLFIGIGSLVTLSINGGGVAYFAHIGGFVFGLILAKLITPSSYRSA